MKPVAIAAVLLAAGCGQPEGGAPDASKASALAGLPAPYNTADLDHGKALFAQCRACHTVVKDGANMTGPNLYGVFGRQAASKEGYDYSDALEAAAFTWDASRLNDWIAAPRTYLPGTKMTFLGFPEEKDRIDLIAYLKVETGYAKP